MNTHNELLDDDEDPMALSESRPLLVWFLGPLLSPLAPWPITTDTARS